ncbi:helix-turn-helix transcriptional regulator [Mycolicibacterium celeriflavum]|uniref:helix-turn-helix transcriptional regulator n=1 Tax=Mycolicibacterium celeriflavum TaxID=1249101 RepID=UPI003CF7E26E
MSALEWSELGVSGLPTGTVTLLLADVEGSTRLWDSQPEEMRAAIRRLDAILADLVVVHNGARPVEQGEGDSFVLAFARASDAVACALALQQAPLAPIRLRIGVHTGEIQLRDEGNYIGTTINRTARLRDLAHGGQTVLTGATESMVLDHLPDDAWLSDLGSHPLRDLPRPERVVQLCHPDIRNDFPPLRTADTALRPDLPAQLTRFIGRRKQIADIRELLTKNRLVTLTGAGGVGKTRLAVQIADRIDSPSVWYVDLAPISDPDLVPVAVLRSLGVPDQPGRSTMDSIVEFIGERAGFAVLDNCEHLLEVSAELITTLLERCPALTLLATSREPIGVDGELIWRVASLSIDDEAVELFVDRARHVQSDFAAGDEELAVIGEICRRLDGMPLAIELAAARVRALSVREILDGLHDRFRLLTGGSRKAVRRQQTLKASVDWSHQMLTEPERVVFRRLAAFAGDFDLEAAQAVAAGGEVERFQVLDLLMLLVDKSLVLAESSSGRVRYRLLETVRQYALDKLGESGEADTVRSRHGDHYASIARLEAPGCADYERLVTRAEIEIDNLRAAFAWSLERRDIDTALRLASSLQPLWLMRGRVQEGLSWFNAVLNEPALEKVCDVVARLSAVADRAVLHAWAVTVGVTEGLEQALATARELDDPVLLLRVLVSCIGASAFDAQAAYPYIDEALELARRLDDRWRLCQILAWKAFIYILIGDPVSAIAAGEEGQSLAEAVGDTFMSRMNRYWGPAMSVYQMGDLKEGTSLLHALLTEADASGDVLHGYLARIGLGHAYVWLGDPATGRSYAEAAIETASTLGPHLEPWAYAPYAFAVLAEGDVKAAADACDWAWQRINAQPETAITNVIPSAELELARGDLSAAREFADADVSLMHGWHLARALVNRTRIALAQGDLAQADEDVRRTIECISAHRSHQVAPDAFEVLGELTCAAGDHRNAARFLGAAAAMRERTGLVRLRVHDAAYAATISLLKESLGETDFEALWDEGTALSIEEAVAYAQRGRGGRKRPASGWNSLTPTELDVVRLVAEGLGNKDIAARLFVSHRTVQTHLTHVYTKLGLASRVQLAQEAARRA